MKKSLTIAALGKRINYKEHIDALNLLFKHKGYEVDFILNSELYDKNLYHKGSLTKTDNLFIIFPFHKMLLYVVYRKIFNKKNYYWFHEPFESYNAYQKSGNTFFWIFQFYIKSFYSFLNCYFCDVIYLPSDKAILNFKNSIFFNKKLQFKKLPLIYPSREDFTKKEKLISYIGTISDDHAFDKFVTMIENNISILRRKKIKAAIITSSTIKNSILKKIYKMKVFTEIHHSRYINEDEISMFYSKTMFLWNAYHRSTQSGVLVNGFRHNCIPIFHETSNIQSISLNYALILKSKDYLIDENEFDYKINNSKSLQKKIDLFFKKHFSYSSQIFNKIFENEF